MDAAELVDAAEQVKALSDALAQIQVYRHNLDQFQLAIREVPEVNIQMPQCGDLPACPMFLTGELHSLSRRLNAGGLADAVTNVKLGLAMVLDRGLDDLERAIRAELKKRASVVERAA